MSVKTIVNIDTDNIGICVCMYCAAFNDDPWNDGWSEAAAFERLSTFTRIPHFHGIVLMVDETPAAMVLGWGERLAHGWTFLIKEMCVHPGYRRAGIGTELLFEFEKILLERKFDSAYLETLERGSSVDFYSTLGFRKIALVMMKKSLG